MSTAVRSSRRWLLAGLSVILLSLIGAASAQACEDRTLERPFVRWLDGASYFLAPDGDFSAGAAGWQLDGAKVIDDNEPWNVHGSDGAGALRLSSGDSAVSPTLCAGLLDPTMRFFARNDGGLLGSLRVDALYVDRGLIRALPVGVLLGLLADDWAPTLPMPILSLAAQPVAFRFTATGIGSRWVIDDLYVDPYRKG